jgi:hypothetical protein
MPKLGVSKSLTRSGELAGGACRRPGAFLEQPGDLAEDLAALEAQTADILVVHDAPSSHPEGFAELDLLARAMGGAADRAWASSRGVSRRR